MKPHVICHMASSLDGRTLPSRWRPKGRGDDVFERLHDRLGGDAWMIGRVTGSEFAKGEPPYPDTAAAPLPREPWRAVEGKPAAWAVVLDAHGKIAWGRKDIGGDPILVVLTETVSDAHLHGLRAEGVSYLFAGREEIDLAALLHTLAADFGVTRLIMEGGGTANGELLRAGLIDEISLALLPTVDGAQGAPSTFDGPKDAPRPPLSTLRLAACERLDDDVIWLRYTITND